MSDETTTEATPKRATLPKTTADVKAVTHIPTTEATRSFAAYVNENLAGADNFEPITDEQAWAIVGCHRPWQQSPERKEELEQLRAANAEEAAKRKAEREAKKAAEAETAYDLDSVDAEGDGEIATPKRRRRKPNAQAEEAAPETGGDTAEVEGF